MEWGGWVQWGCIVECGGGGSAEVGWSAQA